MVWYFKYNGWVRSQLDGRQAHLTPYCLIYIVIIFKEENMNVQNIAPFIISPKLLSTISGGSGMGTELDFAKIVAAPTPPAPPLIPPTPSFFDQVKFGLIQGANGAINGVAVSGPLTDNISLFGKANIGGNYGFGFMAHFPIRF